MRTSDQTTVAKWYAVITKPKAESVATQNLSQQNYLVCAPRLQIKKRRGSRWQTVVEPMFPGYVFVQLSLGVQDASPIRSTTGCRELVCFSNKPQSVPDDVMELFLEAHEIPRIVKPSWTTGEIVRIEEGPFAGIEATFNMPKGSNRVQVLMTALGASRPITIPSTMLSSNRWANC